MRTNLFKLLTAALIAAFALFTAGCTKDVYEPIPEPSPEDQISQDLKDFGFATQGDIKLSVNYNSQNLPILFEVYDVNPLNEETYTKKPDAKPIFAAYTDKNGKFDGSMFIPTAVKEVYLYTTYYGFPKCLKLQVTASGVVYDITASTKSVTTRAAAYDWTNVTFPCLLNNIGTDKYREDNLYALYSWGHFGKIDQTKFTITSSIPKSGESIDQFSRRIQKSIQGLSVAERRANLIVSREVTDIEIKEDNTTLEVTFLGDAAQYANVFGYYCYTEDEYWGYDFSLRKNPKYVVFPNASWLDSQTGLGDDVLVLEKGTTVKLKYIDKSGKVHDSFPKGCKVGWFYGRNSFVRPGTSSSFPDNGIMDVSGSSSYSSVEKRNIKDQRFIALNDTKSGILVLGFEDNYSIVADPNKADPGQEDYMDVLFFVKSNNNITEGKPELPATEEKEEIPTPIYQYGTLGFEDIWPSGGDYDLNDVAVEYNREISFNTSNIATKVTETFKYVQKIGAANFSNYFAYQVDNLGSVSVSEGCYIEPETNSIIVNKVAKESIGEQFVIERTLSGSQSQDEILKDFNPYIIVNSLSKGRKEVHLPNYKATSMVDDKLISTGKDAYYMDKDGAFPFAINIPMLDFNLSPERVSIDQTYPQYKEWVRSYGKSSQDWYKN